MEQAALKPDISRIQDLVAKDMQAVDERLARRLKSEVPLISQLGAYIISAGGKRLRPLIALLSARAAGYQGQAHVDIAVIVELIHTATLLHDDVVDESNMRRGRDTANLVWGNAASVLVGDFLYSRAFQGMIDVGDFRVLEILADATNTIAEGEVMQLVNCHDPDITEQRYLDTIRYKTAKLFEAASELGVVISGRDATREAAMARFGRHLGTAFQLVDDVLDYQADPEDLGKNIGDDLAEGKPTLPLLYAMWNGSEAESATVRRAIEHGGLEQIDAIMALIESTGAIAYTAQLAEREVGEALDALSVMPESPYSEALATLAEFAVQRTS